MKRKKVKPVRTSQASEPTPEEGELRMWRDGSSKSWMLVRDQTAGNVRVEAD